MHTMELQLLFWYAAMQVQNNIFFIKQLHINQLKYEAKVYKRGLSKDKK